MVSYWSPSVAQYAQGTKIPALKMVVGDGGSVINLPLIGLLQRRVENVLLFVNSPLPLATRAKWDPTVRKATADDIDDSLSSFFGVNFAPELLEAVDSSRDQVFAESDFIPIVMALQDSALAGNGAMVTRDLVTVENAWWGIPAGIKTKVTIVYLSRFLKWEERLPADIARQLYVNDGTTNTQQDPSAMAPSGKFSNFPNLNTFTQLNPTIPITNLLSEMCGSLIVENADFFRAALSSNK